jgi:hypothetical protein
MSQVSKLNLISDRRIIDEAFLYRISRKIQRDATTQINNIIYETDSRFASRRVELRYEPEWLSDITKPLPIYEDGKKTGEAKMVRFHDNAHVKRRFAGNRRKDITGTAPATASAAEPAVNTVSFYEIMKGGADNV